MKIYHQLVIMIVANAAPVIKDQQICADADPSLTDVRLLAVCLVALDAGFLKCDELSLILMLLYA